MKKIAILLSTLLLLCGFTFVNAENKGKMPFKKSEVSDTRTMYRAVASGTSGMMQIARDNAMLNCRLELAKKAGQTRDTEGKDDSGNPIIKTIIEGNLKNVKVIKNKIEQDPDTKKYTCWVIMEMPKK